MNSKIKYLPLEWKDGAMFSATQLNEQYKAVADEIRDSSSIDRSIYNYGLLGGTSERRYAESFKDLISSEKVEIGLCRAITLDGSRIEIINRDWESLNTPLATLINKVDIDSDRIWYLLLSVQMFDRTTEQQDPVDGAKEGLAYTRPTYQIQLVSAKDMQISRLANAIPVAKLERSSSGLRKVEDFIPPCTRINAHEKLIDKYHHYDQNLEDLKNNSLKIIEKIKRKRLNKDKNYLAEDIYALCDSYLYFFVNNYDNYRYDFTDSTPVRLLVFFAKLARSLHHSLVSATSKNHVLAYLSKYAIGLSSSQIEDSFKAAYSQTYHHYDSAEALSAIDSFLQILNGIFKELVQLDFNELAPRKLVTDDHFDIPTGTNRPRKIKVKHSGNQSTLGEGLSDSLGDDLD